MHLAVLDVLFWSVLALVVNLKRLELKVKKQMMLEMKIRGCDGFGKAAFAFDGSIYIVR